MVAANKPLLLDAKKAAELVGIGLRTWHTYRAERKLPPAIKLAGRVFWAYSDIQKWIDWRCPPTEQFIELRRKEGMGNG